MRKWKRYGFFDKDLVREPGQKTPHSAIQVRRRLVVARSVRLKPPRRVMPCARQPIASGLLEPYSRVLQPGLTAG